MRINDTVKGVGMVAGAVTVGGIVLQAKDTGAMATVPGQMIIYGGIVTAAVLSMCALIKFGVV